jgi:hypothetical protein
MTVAYTDRELVLVAFGLGEAFWMAPLFSPTGAGAYAELGLNDLSAVYFATRSAPLGTAPAEVVTAAFYNFHPEKVGRYIPSVWERTTPTAVLEAQREVAGQTLLTLLGDWVGSADAREAADLVREAAERRNIAGRPLFAGYSALPWPDDSDTHLTLFHGFTLLREYRGDSHIGVLIANGVDACECGLMMAAAVAGGCECHRVFAATGIRVDVDSPPDPAVLTDREWPVEDRRAALARLVERGLLDEHGQLTHSGMAFHLELERQTDAAATMAWERTRGEQVERLMNLLQEPASLLRRSWSVGGGRIAASRG